MKSIAIFAAAMTFAGTAHAAAETYVIDNAHTFPSFSYSHYGYSTQQSRFDKTSGTITVDREKRTARADIHIDARSVNTGFAPFNEHIQGADFFDTGNHPVITFVSDDFRFDGDVLTEVAGRLTIKGITKPVTMKVTNFKCMPHPMRKKEACGGNASATVRRSDFDMGKYVPAVSDEVTISVAVEAIRE